MDHLHDRYPRLVEYVRSLPAGLGSHPACKARGSVLHAVLAAAGHGALLDAPPELQPVFAPPPRPWVPEVVLQAAVLGVADHLRMDEGSFLAWNHQLNLELYQSGVYRALMAFLSPRTLLERGASRWSAFHQGTVLTVLPDGGGREVSARLDFPHRLFNPLLLRAYAEAFRAALVHSRGRNPSVAVAEEAETHARFLARWE
ncbi:MAG: hypothetical protein QM767_16170 [Anaeromyxobacter sp.]